MRAFTVTIRPVITTNTVPSLRIDRVGPNIVISWPADATDFQLESRTAFVPTSLWTVVSDVPFVTAGRCFVTNSPAGPARFYHLAKIAPATNTAPVLRIDLVSGNVVISWPTNAAGFALQSRIAFDSPELWSSVPDLPAISGARFYVTNSASGTTRFYRLARIIVGPAPQLNISKSGNDVILSWPASATGYLLESSYEVTPAAKHTVVTIPPSIIGSIQSITLPSSASARFFRLRNGQ